MCVCLSGCEFVLQRERGGDMLCSLCLSGGQEWTVLLLAQFYPRGCACAVNGIEMEAHMSVCEGLCLFIKCKMDNAHDTHSNYPGGHFPKFYSNPTNKSSLLKMVRDKMSHIV